MDLSVVYKIGDKNRLPLLDKSLKRMDEQWVDIETVVLLPEHATWATRVDADIVQGVSTGSLCHARNTGARAANADLVAFCDDDAFPDKKWAVQILRGFGGVAAVGGPIKPHLSDSVDHTSIDWLPETWHWLIGCGPYYSKAQWVPNTYGSNLAVDREAFLDVGGFDESIGMGSGGPGQGAETDLCRRLREAGYEAVWYEPSAVMFHTITPDRVAPLALLRRAYEQGAAKAQVGVAGRESRFILDEIKAAGNRPLREQVPAAILTNCVLAGWAIEKLGLPHPTG